MQNIKKNLAKMLLCVFLLTTLVAPAYAMDNESNEFTRFIVAEGLYPIDSSILSPEVAEIMPDFILETDQGSIPVYSSEDLDFGLNELQILLDVALENQPVNDQIPALNTVAEDYEMVFVEEDYTYSFYNHPEGNTAIYINPTDTGEEELIPGAITMTEGIGARAKTSSSSASNISAVMKCDTVPYYAGSIQDMGKTPNSINFYNYIGFTLTGLEADLGFIYSAKYSGWKMFGRVNDVNGSFIYNHNDHASYTSNADFVYKSTSSYPSTMTAEKYNLYNGASRVKLEINGYQTTTLSSATSILIMPRGTTSSVQYKVCTTIATVGDKSNIKKGATITVKNSSIMLAGSGVSSFASLDYCEATINWSSSVLTSIPLRQ